MFLDWSQSLFDGRKEVSRICKSSNRKRRELPPRKTSFDILTSTACIKIVTSQLSLYFSWNMSHQPLIMILKVIKQPKSILFQIPESNYIIYYKPLIWNWIHIFLTIFRSLNFDITKTILSRKASDQNQQQLLLVRRHK